MTISKSTFPLWVILCGFALSLAYLPTLFAPFDFIDDGNLVYSAPDLTVTDHVRVWWDKVRANVEHLGPFRPVVWAHWELAANMYGTDPFAWRSGRLVWCGIAACMLLWLMRELRLHPLAAVLSTAAAMWNPYRNDIWTSLTLAEGVAMPYALFALVSARKAATADRRHWIWDAGAILGLLLALGCKNTFVALIPPMILLRTWTPALSNRGKVLAAVGYSAPVLLAAGHFAYVKLYPGPHHYSTPGPSWFQAGQIASWLKGAAGLDFLGVGTFAALGVVGWAWRKRLPNEAIGKPERAASSGDPHEAAIGNPISEMERGTSGGAPAIVFAVALLLAGFVVYLPVGIMCGRYTMPAVWGADVLLAVLLSRFIALPQSWVKLVAWGLFGVGLAAVLVASVGRQEKLAARSQMLWQMLDAVERDAPPGAVAEWVSGASDSGELNAEEGIHFYWHLLYRGRADVRVRLVDTAGQLVSRVELPPPPGLARYRIGAVLNDDPSWRTFMGVRQKYHLGRRVFTIAVQVPTTPDPLPSGG